MLFANGYPQSPVQVQGSVASSAERGAALLTAKGLDALGLAMLAIAHQRMKVRIGVLEVPALPVRTSEAFGVDPDGALPAGF